MASSSLSAGIKSVLSTHADPLRVLATTASVVQRGKLVKIDSRRARAVAQVLALRPVPVPAWDYAHHFFDGTEKTVTYVFLLDALNFSFWGEPKWHVKQVRRDADGYWGLAAALKSAVESDPRFLDAAFLATLAPEELSRALEGNVEIPMFVERWRNVQELGCVLRDHFGASAARFVEQAHGDAGKLASLVAQNLSSFRDTTIHDGQAVNFYKRAQILAADLYGSFGGEKWGAFRNLQDLTAFADYKLPQLLRAWGILRYGPGLARRVDAKKPLARDSAEEIEIRASMIWGVELLREALAERGRNLTSVQTDWFLW
jgi:hypothetical protein